MAVYPQKSHRERKAQNRSVGPHGLKQCFDQHLSSFGIVGQWSKCAQSGPDQDNVTLFNTQPTQVGNKLPPVGRRRIRRRCDGSTLPKPSS